MPKHPLTDMSDELNSDIFAYNQCSEMLDKLNSSKPRYTLWLELNCSDSRKRSERYSFRCKDEKFMIEALMKEKERQIEELKNKIPLT